MYFNDDHQVMLVITKRSNDQIGGTLNFYLKNNTVTVRFLRLGFDVRKVFFLNLSYFHLDPVFILRINRL